MEYPDDNQPHIILNVLSHGSEESLPPGFCEGVPYTLVNARSGEEAIGICTVNQSVGLVLLRPELAGVNGFETAARIRQTEPDIAIVMIAANLSVGALRLATLAGCNEIISQPVSFSELNALFSRYLNRWPTRVPAGGTEII